MEKIKVIQCRAQGESFKNLTPNSIHVIIDPPEGENNEGSGRGMRGVWVMGVGEPVKLLKGEYVFLKGD